MAGVPIAAARLRDDLTRLGPPPGRDVLVHASMRAVGPVEGGPAATVAGLRAVIGASATIVVPTQTPNNSTTSRAFEEAVRGLDDAARAAYIGDMPGFDRASTPSYGMGALAEHVRRHPGAVRSAHPQTSFTGLGPRAADLMAVHDIDCHLGERSPLAALYDADASVLLLGVGFEVCTALHLAEYRRAHRRTRDYECFTIENGIRVRCKFRAVDLDDHDFGKIGEAFENEVGVRIGRIGNGTARVVPMRHLVDFALRWMDAHRWP